MTLHFGIAAEDAALARIVRELADEVVCKEINWLTRQVLDQARTWGGLSVETQYLALKDAFRTARARGLQVHGHFNGEPAALDAHMARAALLLFSDPRIARPTPAVVVLARDTDRRDRRGLAQAATATSWAFHVLIAAPHPEVEAWIVAGFVPESDDERSEVQELRRELHFDPTAEPARLTSTARQSSRDAKRVAERLTSSDTARVGRCIVELANGSRGSDAGATDYVAEVRQKLVPLLTSHARPHS